MLSDKPSELIELAMRDLEWAEGQPNYHINMDIFYYKQPNGICEICLAGAVIARRLLVEETKQISSSRLLINHFPVFQDKLISLDYFRRGSVRLGLKALRIDVNKISEVPESIKITPYSMNTNEFKRDMNGLMILLKEHGL